jgi:hypothetical protein
MRRMWSTMRLVVVPRLVDELSNIGPCAVGVPARPVADQFKRHSPVGLPLRPFRTAAAVEAGTTAIATRPQMTIDSYDRCIPAQDYLPTNAKGPYRFGNLTGGWPVAALSREPMEPVRAALGFLGALRKTRME